MTADEMAKVVEEATRALEMATQRIRELQTQLDSALSLYNAIAAERDHWYSVAIGGA